MHRFYKEYVWELHYYEQYGDDAGEAIYGWDGSADYEGGYSVINLDYVDNNEEYDFSIPEATKENPYPCPEYVQELRESRYEPYSYKTFWMNPNLR